MRYLRLQRSQANRRRAEREAERGLAQRTQPAQPEGTARECVAPVGQEPRRRKEN
ncbi:MAG: hypothetical protein KKD25_06775 [Gammaproteobacteria bacterium]|jgi:hypothetical protein|nr:hypothetical protein [Gammaproteobacteria bacterium]MBU0772297.1 hypothetical protein [Gammaproteobacteria bacterium]MBU0857908.1 hypothetical protein [Gammaproteobacteria bacterium]MBU1848424.1 hypothetical protein [Gammaproteobacteria bacterium]